MRGWKTLIVSLFLLLCVLIGFLSLTFLALLFVRKISKGSDFQDMKQLHTYQVLRKNFETEESFYGIVTSYEGLEDEQEFRTKRLDESTFEMYSEFGLPEYVCHGSCYCETDESRRSVNNHASKLTKPLFTLVASMSSVLAVEFARRHFLDDCENSDISCPNSDSTIKSDVEECQEAVHVDMEFTPLPFPTDFTLEDENENEREKRENDEEKYLCSGRCLTYRFDMMSSFFEELFNQEPDTFPPGFDPASSSEKFQAVMEPVQKQADEFGCEAMSLEKEVHVSTEKKIREELREKVLKGKKNPMKALTVETPEMYFIEGELRKFCTENSYAGNELFDQYKYLFPGGDSDFPLCTSQIHEVLMETSGKRIQDSPNPTVKCRKIPNVQNVIHL